MVVVTLVTQLLIIAKLALRLTTFLENFDHEKLKSSDHDGVVLQSELDKLSTEIEKEEEKIAGLGLQAQKSAHDQVSKLNQMFLFLLYRLIFIIFFKM